MTAAHDLVGAIRQDLAMCEEMAQWAYSDGWHPKGRNADSTSRPIPMQVRDAQRIGKADPDQIPGARDDVALGEYGARVAYRTAAIELRTVHAHLIVAAQAAGQLRQPAVRPWPKAACPELGVLLTAVQAMRMLLDLVSAGTPTRTVTTHLGHARRHTDLGWKTLTAYMNRGSADPDEHAVGDPTTKPKPKKLCKVCKIRARVSGEGGRCSTCGKFFRRKGYERPTSMDPLHGGRAAQARRRARGEGHGDESFSGARGWPRS